MLEHTLEYERGLFFLLNGSNYAFMDNFLWLISSKTAWIPLIIFILFILIYRKPWRETILILLAIAIVITLCDQFASHLCKQLFARPRPTHHPDFMNEVKTVFGYRGGKYGFMSSHAANAFGFAVLMSCIFRHKIFTAAIMTWAALTAYSRIYLGVHFPTDVLAGAITGVIFGYTVYACYRGIRKKNRNSFPHSLAELYSTKEKTMIAAGVSITILILLILNQPLVAILHQG
jgi:undecaprenyl-diphosphatase